ncbi:hypothetical protein [Actinacidiphila soli]|uniref:hypothetical protein n=1 Tax=Actinacidiphila soli TaxID=2487275 RepID=UPI000FCA1BD5|nr:hypothetical protein [Actinacidiphila soli]
MLAKAPQARPSAAAVYEALLPLASAEGESSGGDESRDPTWPDPDPEPEPEAELVKPARSRPRKATDEQ